MTYLIIGIALYYLVSTILGIAIYIEVEPDLFYHELYTDRKPQYRLTKFGAFILPILMFIACPILYVIRFLQWAIFGE